MPKPLIEEIRELEVAGVLGPENCPSETYWSWPILQFHRLPQYLKEQSMMWGEVRW